VKEITARKLPEEKESPVSFSKTDTRYWLASGRLFKEKGCPHFYCRFAAKGKRGRFALDTPNQKVAAAKAAEIYRRVVAVGWDAALEQYRPQVAPETVRAATVGDLIEIACSVSSARRHSLDAYTKAFRRIVSEIKGIAKGRKFDAAKGGSLAWRQQVDAITLAELLPSDVQTWKNRRLREHEADPIARRKATVTVNSLIRNAKALLGKKLLPFLDQRLAIPRPLPFDGIALEKGPSLRYASKIDAYAVLARAKEELAADEPEVLKVLVLAMVCGLRRSEIDHLLWRAFDFNRSILRVENTEYHQLKSEDSAGEVDLDPGTCAWFHHARAKHPKSLFVIESPNPPRIQGLSRFYRCDSIFQRANEWLRTQGVTDGKPLHTLRKEIGSIIASEHGIFAASRYLRHSDIRITSAFYADKKQVVTPKTFSGLL
jgi:integrase